MEKHSFEHEHNMNLNTTSVEWTKEKDGRRKSFEQVPLHLLDDSNMFSPHKRDRLKGRISSGKKNLCGNFLFPLELNCFLVNALDLDFIF